MVHSHIWPTCHLHPSPHFHSEDPYACPKVDMVSLHMPLGGHTHIPGHPIVGWIPSPEYHRHTGLPIHHYPPISAPSPFTLWPVHLSTASFPPLHPNTHHANPVMATTPMSPPQNQPAPPLSTTTNMTTGVRVWPKPCPIYGYMQVDELPEAMLDAIIRCRWKSPVTAALDKMTVK